MEIWRTIDGQLQKKALSKEESSKPLITVISNVMAKEERDFLIVFNTQEVADFAEAGKLSGRGDSAKSFIELTLAFLRRYETADVCCTYVSPEHGCPIGVPPDEMLLAIHVK
jgi:hypothetical protein